MRKLRIFILFFICTTTLLAQNAGKADSFFQDANYVAAQKEYGLLLRRYPTSALYLYRYARCAQELGDYHTAIQYFEKAGNRYDLKHFNVGEIYLHLGYPDEAISAYTSYLKTLKQEPERELLVQSRIRQAEIMQRYMKRVEKVQIIDSIEVPLDSLLLVYQLSAEAGTLSFDSLGQVVYTNQRKDRKLWSTLLDSIHWIVSSRNLMDTWTTPDPLPIDVNMSHDQNYPYMLNDGVTLYFASKDTSGLGGYDIYVSRYNTYTNTYTTPENLGFPYNSPANDYLMVIDEAHQIGYFATDRRSKSEHVHIYTFVLPEQKSYWRNISQDSLVGYAQLRYALMADESMITKPIAPIVESNNEKKDEIFFVLNDSVVYTSITDFQSAVAQKIYQEWNNLQQQLELDKITLEQMRQQYGKAEDERRKELAPLILKMEKKQSQLQVQCEHLLQSIRKTENEKYQQ